MSGRVRPQQQEQQHEIVRQIHAHGHKQYYDILPELANAIA